MASFLGRVTDLTRTARKLQTLAERISAGEARSGGVARRMSFDEFARRVAEFEGSSPLVAREHAVAVLATLREAIGDGEFFDVTVQLPDDYLRALPRAG
jgi:hypothetical protein